MSRLRREFQCLGLGAILGYTAPGYSFDDSLLRGFVAGCIDQQQRLHQDPLTIDMKRNILNFCYCRAPSMAALIPDAESKQKLLLKDPDFMAAIARIDATCIEGVKSGRRFYPANE